METEDLVENIHERASNDARRKVDVGARGAVCAVDGCLEAVHEEAGAGGRHDADGHLRGEAENEEQNYIDTMMTLQAMMPDFVRERITDCLKINLLGAELAFYQGEQIVYSLGRFLFDDAQWRMITSVFEEGGGTVTMPRCVPSNTAEVNKSQEVQDLGLTFKINERNDTTNTPHENIDVKIDAIPDAKENTLVNRVTNLGNALAHSSGKLDKLIDSVREDISELNRNVDHLYDRLDNLEEDQTNKIVNIVEDRAETIKNMFTEMFKNF